MDVTLRQALGQYVIERLGPKPRARAGQRPDLTIERAVPGGAFNACRKQMVEYFRTCCRQQKSALVAIDTAAGKHRPRLCHIAALATEALLAEIIGHTTLGDLCKHLLGGCAIAFDVAQHKHETIAAQRTALQLASMPSCRKHFGFGRRKDCPVRLRLAGKADRKGLSRHRVAVLEPGVAYVEWRHTGVTGQFTRYPIGVRTTLLHP